jgi:hypothetical protein
MMLIVPAAGPPSLSEFERLHLSKLRTSCSLSSPVPGTIQQDLMDSEAVYVAIKLLFRMTHQICQSQCLPLAQACTR